MTSSSARAYDPVEDLHTIHVPADPNGLAYDRHGDTLYLADGDTGDVLAIDQGRRRRIATIDDAGMVAANRLGGLAVTPDGTLYVARLGHGHAGAIFRIANGEVTPLAQLSPLAWRLGVTYDAAEHALYATEYHKAATGPCDGAIVRIDLVTGDVVPVIDGLQKPVGVAKLGSTLVVTDSRRRVVYRVELVAGRAVVCTPLATGLDRPDSVAACGPDSVLVTTYAPETGMGSVRQIWLHGLVRTIARGAWEPRGIATDGERAFVAVRGGGRVLVLPI